LIQAWPLPGLLLPVENDGTTCGSVLTSCSALTTPVCLNASACSETTGLAAS